MTAEYVDSLPDTIRVGPFEVIIKKVPDLPSDWGELVAQTITIVADQPSKEWAVDTLLHELLHFVWKCGHLEEKASEERAVRVIATGLTGIFKDNPKLMQWIMQAYD